MNQNIKYKLFDKLITEVKDANEFNFSLKGSKFNGIYIYSGGEQIGKSKIQKVGIEIHKEGNEKYVFNSYSISCNRAFCCKKGRIAISKYCRLRIPHFGNIEFISYYKKRKESIFPDIIVKVFRNGKKVLNGKVTYRFLFVRTYEFISLDKYFSSKNKNFKYASPYVNRIKYLLLGKEEFHSVEDGEALFYARLCIYFYNGVDFSGG